MSHTHHHKWTAFFLSLAVPGSGQLYLRNCVCLFWFLLVGGVIAFFSLSLGTPSWFHSAGQVFCLLLIGIVSAEHAKRLAEPKGNVDQERKCTKVTFHQRTGRRMDISIDLIVPHNVNDVWNKIADLQRFLTIDPFHEQVVLMRQTPAVGVHLGLKHNAFGWRFWRFGKIIRWREGSEFAFSDLSQRGPRSGFPHVFFVRVEPQHDHQTPATRLTIRVRGKWTSRFIPVTLGRLWIWLVFRDHARLLKKAF